eukprot:TRINITY_DN5743_c1_g2_i1.p1 TRINITY_DN5743_c1_g2~~TRINITY_DN5743_c1_g2_i1.p1  ORF type:complete len:1109 (+),score=278.21 TRINITY_DN5743_c1_g2_i1:60-3386(+)
MFASRKNPFASQFTSHASRSLQRGDGGDLSPQSFCSPPQGSLLGDQSLTQMQKRVADIESWRAMVDVKLSDIERNLKEFRANIQFHAQNSSGTAERTQEATACLPDVASIRTQLLDMRQELRSAAKQDEELQADLKRKLLAELRPELRKRLTDDLSKLLSSLGKRTKQESTLASTHESQVSATRAELGEVASLLRDELSRLAGEGLGEGAFSADAVGPWKRPGDGLEELQASVAQLTGATCELREQLKANSAPRTPEPPRPSGEEMEYRMESRLGGMQQELSKVVVSEVSKLRRDREGESEALRRELRSSVESEMERRCKELRSEVSLRAKGLQEAQRDAAEKSQSHHSDLRKLSEELVTVQGVVQKLRSEHRAVERPVGGAEVEEMIKKALSGAQLKVSCQSFCEELLEPLRISLRASAAEASQAQTAVAEASKQAWNKLEGTLRAEASEAAEKAALRSRQGLDRELRDLVEGVRRELLAALEAAGSRTTFQLEQKAAAQSADMDGIRDRLKDAERGASDLGSEIRGLRGQVVELEAARNSGQRALASESLAAEEMARQLRHDFRGVEVAAREAASISRGVDMTAREALSLSQEAASQSRELQAVVAAVDLQNAEISQQVQQLMGEAAAGQQRLDTLAVLLETANVRLDAAEAHVAKAETTSKPLQMQPASVVQMPPAAAGGESPQWREAVRDMHQLTEMVGNLESHGDHQGSSLGSEQLHSVLLENLRAETAKVKEDLRTEIDIAKGHANQLREEFQGSLASLQGQVQAQNKLQSELTGVKSAMGGMHEHDTSSRSVQLHSVLLESLQTETVKVRGDLRNEQNHTNQMCEEFRGSIATLRGQVGSLQSELDEMHEQFQGVLALSEVQDAVRSHEITQAKLAELQSQQEKTMGEVTKIKGSIGGLIDEVQGNLTQVHSYAKNVVNKQAHSITQLRAELSAEIATVRRMSVDAQRRASEIVQQPLPPKVVKASEASKAEKLGRQTQNDSMVSARSFKTAQEESEYDDEESEESASTDPDPEVDVSQRVSSDKAVRRQEQQLKNGSARTASASSRDATSRERDLENMRHRLRQARDLEDAPTTASVSERRDVVTAKPNQNPSGKRHSIS